MGRSTAGAFFSGRRMKDRTARRSVRNFTSEAVGFCPADLFFRQIYAVLGLGKIVPTTCLLSDWPPFSGKPSVWIGWPSTPSLGTGTGTWEMTESFLITIRAGGFVPLPSLVMRNSCFTTRTTWRRAICRLREQCLEPTRTIPFPRCGMQFVGERHLDGLEKLCRILLTPPCSGISEKQPRLAARMIQIRAKRILKL